MNKYLLKIKWHIIISLLLYTLETIVTSIILLLPGYLVDHYIEGISSIYYMVMVYFISFNVYLLICFFSNRLSDYRRVKFEKYVKKDFFNAIIEKNYYEFGKYDIGEYLSMQANDITMMCQNYLSPLLSVYRSLVMVIVYGVSLVIFVDASIALAILLGSLMAVCVPRLTAKELSKRNSNYLKNIGKYTSSIKRYFESRDILDKRSIKRIESIHEKELDSVLADNMYFRKLNSFAMVLNGGAVEFISVVTFILVAILLYSGELTIGMATAAFIYSTKFMDPIHELNINIGRIKSVKGIIKKLMTIMEEKNNDSLRCPSNIKKIDIRNVTKKFKELEIAIPNMQFIYPNKYLIIGDNGAGKSVLLRMLMGFYKSDSGDILYDGLTDNNIDRLNAYVPQHPVIFEASYYDNITLYGTYDDQDLMLYESYFPLDLIKRVKSNIMSKNFSGGEKQVIGLLRALCSKKPVLLLDEPFSAMNNKAIIKFLSHMDQINCMMIVIAHNINDYSCFKSVHTIERLNKKE